MRIIQLIPFLSIITILCFFQVSGCSKNVVKQDNTLQHTSQDSESSFLSILEIINNNSPDSYSTNFVIDGIINNKKFKTTGKAIYNKSPNIMKITFLDAIFKSLLTTILKEGDILKIYFPIEKRLFIDNIKTIDLKKYIEINANINIKLFTDLMAGQVPIIKNYSVKKILTEKSDKPEKGESSFLILENKRYFETISFKKKIPDKILWVDKRTKEKTEVYIEDMYTKKNISFYQTLRFVNKALKYRINIRIKNVKFNIPIDLKRISKINLPRDAKVLKLN